MKKILAYFNLNNHVKQGATKTGVVILSEENPPTGRSADHKPIRYEETREGAVRSTMAAPETPTQVNQKRISMSAGEQVLMYLGIFLGVLLSSAVMQYQKGQLKSLHLNLLSVLMAGLIAFLIVPSVFEKLRMTPESPLLVRFGFFVQQGVFWQVILEGFSKVV